MHGSVTRPRRQAPWAGLLLFPGIAILLSLTCALMILVRYSFNSWDPVRMMVPNWSFMNYSAFVHDRFLGRVFVDTVQLSAVTTLVCLILGYPVAYGIATSPRRNLLIFLLITPMMVDVLLRTYAWFLMLGERGFINVMMHMLGLWPTPHRLLFTKLSVTLELIHELVPFMVLPIASVLERIDPALSEAAMNLGAGPVGTFLRIKLPLSIPGVVAGTLLTFALAMSSFVAPLLLGGGRVTTMTILIQQQMLTTLNWPLGAAEALVLVLIVLAMLAVYRRLLIPRGSS
jgi:ABC-type spermidine/putrescine transport system permease subunit I